MIREITAAASMSRFKSRGSTPLCIWSSFLNFDVGYVGRTGLCSQKIREHCIVHVVCNAQIDETNAVLLFKASRVAYEIVNNLWKHCFASHNRRTNGVSSAQFYNLSRKNGHAMKPKRVLHAQQNCDPLPITFISWKSRSTLLVWFIEHDHTISRF